MVGDTAAPGPRFRVLGPVRVWIDGTWAPAGSPQQRALLAVLLLHGNRSVTADELIDALWGDTPPDSALATLRTYAFRLRKLLGKGALVSTSGGYALRFAPDSLDFAVAERHATEAERARAAGDAARARQLYAAALDLWDGEPLAGIPGPFAEAWRSRLAERRLSLLETRLETDLHLGAHAEVVSELTALASEHPLRERLGSLLMLALYRAGRQAEALQVFTDARRLLIDELGVEPGPELSELHQRILVCDPGLLPEPEPRSPAQRTPLRRPAQLPRATAHFVGRAAESDALTGQLASGRETVAVCVVAGPGGVGKSALACEVAHSLVAEYPDGQLFLELGGLTGRPLDPADALGALLRSLGLADQELPERLPERAALFRSTLAGRRVLILLDDARDADQVLPLLPGTAGCAVLITSRTLLPELTGTYRLVLDGLSTDESMRLLAKAVGEERVAEDRASALDIARLCGRLPLALQIAASRLATRGGWTVSDLARKLTDERRRLDQLAAGKLAVRPVFDAGYRRLDADQARAFRLLSLPAGPDICLDAAAAVLDLDVHRTEPLAEALVDANCMASAYPGRYGFQPLLGVYARQRAQDEETAQDRRAALSRLLDFYLASAVRAHGVQNPGDRLLDHLVATTRPGLLFDTRGEARDRLFTEAAPLLSAVERSAHDADDAGLRRAADLLLVCQELLWSGYHTKLTERAVTAVVAASAARAHTTAEGRARLLLGQLRMRAGRLSEAENEAERASLLAAAAEDPICLGHAGNLRGAIALRRGRFEESVALLNSALTDFRADTNAYGEAAVLGDLALARAGAPDGDLKAALECAEQAVEIYRREGATTRTAYGYYALGTVLCAADEPDRALAVLERALAVFREGRQRYWKSMTLLRTAEAYRAMGMQVPSATTAEEGRELLRDLDPPAADSPSCGGSSRPAGTST